MNAVAGPSTLLRRAWTTLSPRHLCETPIHVRSIHLRPPKFTAGLSRPAQPEGADERTQQRNRQGGKERDDAFGVSHRKLPQKLDARGGRDRDRKQPDNDVSLRDGNGEGKITRRDQGRLGEGVYLRGLGTTMSPSLRLRATSKEHTIDARTVDQDGWTDVSGRDTGLSHRDRDRGDVGKGIGVDDLGSHGAETSRDTSRDDNLLFYNRMSSGDRHGDGKARGSSETRIGREDERTGPFASVPKRWVSAASQKEVSLGWSQYALGVGVWVYDMSVVKLRESRESRVIGPRCETCMRDYDRVTLKREYKEQTNRSQMI